MEEPIKCPNCLGYGCPVIYPDEEKLRICTGFEKDKSADICSYNYKCCCGLCNGSGCVSWIDLLFNNNERYKETFERLRNNIKEIEELMKMRTIWKK